MSDEFSAEYRGMWLLPQQRPMTDGTYYYWRGKRRRDRWRIWVARWILRGVVTVPMKERWICQSSTSSAGHPVEGTEG